MKATPPEITEAFSEAVIYVFERALNSKIDMSLARIDGKEDLFCSAISCVGEETLSFILSFEANSAMAITEAYFGLALALDSPDLKDAIGELVNVVAGYAVENLEKVDILTEMSLPLFAHSVDELQTDGKMIGCTLYKVKDIAFDLRIYPGRVARTSLPGKKPYDASEQSQPV
jgi:CheY-specific phosphatase CheX